MKSLLPIAAGLVALSACSPFDQALLSPNASFLNGQKVGSVPREKSVTFVGSQTNEYGERMPVYPESSRSAHKILHVSPPPQFIFAACDGARGRGRQMVEGDFQAGKTYQLYCNLHYDDRYKIVAREVPNGTTMNTNHVMNIYYQNGKPTDANRIRFVSTGRRTVAFWKKSVCIGTIRCVFWAGTANFQAPQSWLPPQTA